MPTNEFKARQAGGKLKDQVGISVEDITEEQVMRLANGQHPETGERLIPDAIKSKDEFTSGQQEAAAAVYAFAKRWDKKLTEIGKAAQCLCGTNAEDEFAHHPECPVARILQAARLMGEEGETVREEAFGLKRLGVGGEEE